MLPLQTLCFDNHPQTPVYPTQKSKKVRTLMTQPASTSVNTNTSRCQFRFANRKRCRMSTRNYDNFCPPHAKAHQIEATATELTANLDKFKSVAELHDFLSRLLLLLAQNKISPRRAAVLAYITNQLLRTIN
jgi:hypothetical protein